jgi:hypothetical protein
LNNNINKKILIRRLHIHSLKFTNIRKHFNYEKYGWLCDFCESGKEPYERSYYCSKCGLDICDECVKSVKDKLPKNNIHSHILILDKVVDWVCNLCKKKGNNSYAWSCSPCDFDCCIKCYWELENSGNLN